MAPRPASHCPASCPGHPRPACAVPEAICQRHPLPRAIARQAFLLPSGGQEPREALLSSTSAGLLVIAPRSPNALEPAPETNQRLGAGSWTSAEQASYRGRGRGPEPQRAPGRSRGLSPERKSMCPPSTFQPSHPPLRSLGERFFGAGCTPPVGGVVKGSRPSPHGPAMFFLEPLESLLLSRGLHGDPTSQDPVLLQSRPEPGPS